ncbi:Protein of unknown function, partial [Gryllus bimaculatus]
EWSGNGTLIVAREDPSGPQVGEHGSLAGDHELNSSTTARVDDTPARNGPKSTKLEAKRNSNSVIGPTPPLVLT